MEWIAGLLPTGGTGYHRPEWDDHARRDLERRFFASPFAAALTHTDDRELFDSVLWFACDYGPGDPLRWSAVAVEIILVDWIPRKIVAEATFLSRAPEILRAFVRFADHERAIRAALTDETLAAINYWEPEYQAIIREPRPQGPEAVLAAVGAFDPDADLAAHDERIAAISAIMLDDLAAVVGGTEALANLTDSPLPDELFSWDGIADDSGAEVEEILGLCDHACEAMLDPEYRTACRRLLARSRAVSRRSSAARAGPRSTPRRCA